MADNNDLKVVVGLNLPKSVVEIEDDFKIIEKTLANSDKGKLKITAGLNVGKTIGIINKQLSELKIDGSRLKITPTLDISVGNQMAQQVNNQINSAFSQIDFKHIAREIRDLLNIKKNSGIKEITKDIQTMYESFNVDPDKYKEAFNNILNWYQARSDDFIFTEKEKIKQLNNFLTDSYNTPDLFTTFPKMKTWTKDDPLKVTQQTLAEMEHILGSIDKVKELFGVIQVDNEHGKTIFSFMEDWKPKNVNESLDTYIEYLQKIQELRKRNRLTLDEYRSKDENGIWINQIEEAILKQYKFIDVGNRVAQTNEQVAQSERDIAEAQKEIQSAGGDQLSFNDQKTAENLEKTKELNNELIQGEKELVNLEKERTEIQNRLDQNKDAFKTAFEFDDNYDKLESAIKKDEDSLKRIEQEITNKTSANKVIKDQIEELSNQLREESQKINQSTQNMGSASGADVGTSSEYLSSNISKITSVVNSAKAAEQSFKNLLASMGDTKGTVVSKEFADAAGKVNSFTVAVKSGTGAFETFKYSIDGENGGFKLDNITAANAGIQRLTESTEKFKATLEAQATILKANANALKSQWEDSNGGKSVRNEEHVAKLTEKYNVLIATIEKLRSADSITATEIKGNIKAQETDIKSLISAYHNAEKVATSLRARDTETSIINTKNNIREFMSNLNASKVSFTAVEDELQKLAQAMQALDGATSGDKAARLRDVLNAFENLQTKFKAENAIAKNFNDISKSVEKVITDLNAMGRTQIFNTHSNDAGVIEFQDKIKGLSDTAKKVKADLNALGDSKAIPPELKARIEDVKKRFDELNGSNKTLQANLRQNDGWARTERQIQTLTARIKEYMAVNTKAAKKYSSNFDGLLSGLSQAEINKDSEAVRRLSADFQILQHEIKAAGDQGKTLFERIKADVSKFTGWLSITTVVSTGVREIRKMVQEVVKLDNSLLELSKVSDLTSDGIKRVTERAFELSKQVGKTGTDVIDATTNFKRAGFELEESINLAEKALVLTNVAEGIDDAGEAATALISIMKGYGDTSTEFAQKILDAVNEVSNTQAIDFDSLIDGSQRLAAVAKQGGASFEQMLGILTGTNEVLQNIEKTSSGAITIFTRLQSVQLPDEEDVLPLAKLQETFNKNTNGMVNIIDQTTGELRNVYDILNDISEVWDTLDKNTQEGLAFAAAGTRQKNVFLSMMENWDNVKKSVESATNSMGSATEENQKYLDSISGRLSIVESNFQSLSQTVVNSDLVKFLVSGAGGALGLLDNIISKFGTLQTLLPIIMGSLSAFKNVGRAKMSALKMEYADCNVVVTRNEFMIA